MIRSMTGFGRSVKESDRWLVCAEIRSLNSRGYRFQGNIPRELFPLEAFFRKTVRESISRGTVELSITVEDKLPHRSVRISSETLLEYCRLLREAGVEFTVQLGDLVSLPGVLREHPNGLTEELEALSTEALKEALQNLIAMRETEGEALRAELENYAERLTELLNELKELHTASISEYRERVKSRLQRALAEFGANSESLNREIILYVERSDITEEIIRLESHCSQLCDFLERGGACGRELEFLAREMHRESNTLADKSLSPEVDRIAIEFCGLVEKIREQVANIE